MKWEKMNFDGEEEYFSPIEKDCPVFTSDGTLATVLEVNGDQVTCVISAFPVGPCRNDEGRIQIVTEDMKDLQPVPVHPMVLSVIQFFNEEE